MRSVACVIARSHYYSRRGRRFENFRRNRYVYIFRYLRVFRLFGTATYNVVLLLLARRDSRACAYFGHFLPTRRAQDNFTAKENTRPPAPDLRGITRVYENSRR